MYLECRRALSALIRARRVTVPAVVICALAAGGNAAIFSIVDSVLLRPLPYRDAAQLVDLFTWDNLEHLIGRRTGYRGVSSEGAADVRAMTALFEAFSGYQEPREATVERNGHTERGAVGRLGPGMLALFGLSPVAGREFTAGDVRGGDVAIIGEGYWRRAFGGEPGAVGDRLTIEGRQYRIVGISPSTLRFGVGGAPGAIIGTEVWLPLEPDAPDGIVPLIGRLAEGVTLSVAQRELADRIASLRISGSATWQRSTLELRPLGSLASPPPRQALVAIWSALALVLLLACANVSNLMLYRALAREDVTRMHALLGARPWQIARMFLAEGLVLALASVPAAAAVCAVLLGALPRLASSVTGAWIYAIETPRLGLRTLAFLSVLSVAVGLGIAVVSAYRGSRVTGVPSSVQQIAGPSRRHRGAARGLQAVQVAFTIVLVAGFLGLLARFVALTAVDLGYQAADLAYVSFEAQPGEPEASRRAFMDALRSRVEVLPGVQRALVADTPGRASFTDSVRSEAAPSAGVLAAVYRVPGEYFVVCGIPVRRGAIPAELDAAAASHAVISQSLADHLWPGRDPIGRVVRSTAGPHVVAAVVGDIKGRAYTRGMPEYQMYLSPEPGRSGMTLLVRASDPAAVLGSVQAIAQSLDHAPDVRRSGPVIDVYAPILAPMRVGTAAAGAVAAVGIVIAMVGLYGLLSFAVRRRDAEIAVRIALGAQPQHVRAVVWGEAIGPLALGVAAGVAIVVMLVPLLDGLFGSTTLSRTSTIAGAVVVVLVSACGAVVPACRQALSIGQIRLTAGMDPGR